ncbi:MAG: RNA polymerase factor sigma-54 [Deltaproteobacteria bacterium]|nr:RNA polymerase factor sigma-54 [Deltaproteobacteria bacterium]
MEIRQELSTKLLQKLVLTPQLQLAIRLLQLSRLELAEEIREQLETNPVLDEESNGSDAVSLDEAAKEVPGAEELPGAPKAPVETAEDHQESRSDRLERGDAAEWEKFVEGYNRFGQGPSIRVSNDEFPSVESTISHKQTLQDHMMWQLQLIDMPDGARDIGAFIIGNLNDDGYLVEVDVGDIAGATGSSMEEVETTLTRLQAFDPVGVCARDLKECLLIQAKTHHPDNEPLRQLIEDHLHDLERRNFTAIARGLHCSMEEVGILITTIQGMEPKPGRAFASDDVVYIQPDVYVYKVGDEYVTVLNEDGLPKLRISPYYEQALSGSVDGGAREFVQEKLRSALWLIRSIHQRQSTIRKVTESIMRFQVDFLEKGVTQLKPLVLRDVAEDVGMHESTISRVTTNKYVYTPRGIFELKYFFNSRVGSLTGDDVSSESVKARIKMLVDKEDRSKPLSDQEIVNLLRKEDTVIARRTVAKYRQALGILPSSRRKAIV